VQFFLSFKVHSTGRDSATRREFSIFNDIYKLNIFLCFSNIRNHLSNLNYLVCISCKIFNRSQFYFTENSRRGVAESRSVCVGLNKGGLLHFFKN
jgi:hypothetical protein